MRFTQLDRQKLAALAAAVLLVGCQGAGEAPAAAAAADGLERVDDEIATTALEDGPTAGLSIGVARGAKTVLAKGYGYADLENRVPATADTVYRIGSITKQLTALAIMQLIEAGDLSLDDVLTNYLPGWPAPSDPRNRSPAPQSHVRHQELHGARRALARQDAARSEPRRTARARQGRTLRFRAGPALEVQQLRLLSARRDHREGQRKDLRGVLGGKRFRTVGPRLHPLLQPASAHQEPRRRLLTPRRGADQRTIF